MNVARWLLFPALMVLAGCIPSLHPLYEDDQLVYSPDLIGTWKGPEDDTMVFMKPDDDGLYKLVYVDRIDTAVVFRAGLTRIGDRMYVDFYPVTPGAIDQNEFFGVHFSSWHTFAQVALTDHTLDIRFGDALWLSDYVERSPDAIAHYFADGIRLTAETTELRAFVSRHDALFKAEPSRYLRQ